MFVIYEAEPVFSPRPWGDIALNEAFGVATHEPVGEVWLLSDMPSMVTRLRTENSFKSPSEITECFSGRALTRFPLLVKLISASSWLSYQVHPGDEMAKEVENEPWGKSECWYFLSNSKIAAGLREPDSFSSRYEFDENSLNLFSPERGDSICIEPGLVHAIGPGTRLLEVQQASDLTYRLFDWGRNRELHTERGNSAVRPYLKPRLMKNAREVISDLFSIRITCRAAGTGIMVTLDSTPVLSVVIDDQVREEKEFMWITLGKYWGEASA